MSVLGPLTIRPDLNEALKNKRLGVWLWRYTAINIPSYKFVHVWTIDKEDEMNRLIKLGVDGLMTDKPSVLKQVMVNKGLF